MKFRKWLENQTKEIKLVQLFPCHGIGGYTEDRHKWIADEWFTDGSKKEHVMEFETPEEAQKYYKPILDHLSVSEYDPKTGYSGVENANFIVTGSHTICKSCQKYQREFYAI